MTDIVEKLRAKWVADVNSCPQCGADDTDQTDGLMREAADEIERLREEIMKPRRPSADDMFALMNEINDLKKSLHKANSENSRILQRMRDEVASRSKEEMGDD